MDKQAHQITAAIVSCFLMLILFSLGLGLYSQNQQRVAEAPTLPIKILK